MKIFNTVVFLGLLICGFRTEDYYYNYDYETIYHRRNTAKTQKPVLDWCTLSCDTVENIACAHGNKCDIKTPCAEVNLSKEKIIEKHNELRNKFATGAEQAAGDILVSNMMAVKWDQDLAYLARCNMVECTELKEDLCHKTSIFSVVGQNLWQFTGSNDVDCAEKALDGIQSWYDEVYQTDPNELKKQAESYRSDDRIRHFSQLIWASTTHIGCAMTRKQDMDTTCMLVCNYGPGVRLKASAFHQGFPCSECPDRYCQINGLCWIPDQRNMSKRSLNKVASLRPSIYMLTISVFLSINVLLNKD